MEPQFYKGNRDAFMEKLAPGSLALFFSGVPVRKTADEDYAYFANRNFVYLTGMEQNNPDVGKGCVRVSGDPVYSASESDRREMDRSKNEAGGD